MNELLPQPSLKVPVAVERTQKVAVQPMTLRLRRRLRKSRAPLLILACLACPLFYKALLAHNSDIGAVIATAGASHDRGSRVQQKLSDKASAVQEMTRFAWRGYLAFCALKHSGNELAPATNSCSPNSDGLVGPNNLLTVIDSLDTLILMGLTEEFRQGRDLVERMFDPTKITAEMNVFETTIRMIGGLLGAYSLSEDPLFARLANQVGEGLSGAFSDGSFPHSVKLFSNLPKKLSEPFSSEATNPAEVGSLYLEFAYLSEITGDNKFVEWVDRNQKALMNVSSMDGVLPISVIAKSPWKLEPDGLVYSIGAFGDSYYEYLVKRCLFDPKANANCIRVFTRSLDGIMKHLAVKTATNETCITNVDGAGAKKQCVMEHLTCFAGGMFALAYLQDPSRTDWLAFAEDVTRTCYLSYLHSATGLGPEIFYYNDKSKRLLARDDKYILRPETVESIYYLHHITGKQVYLDWGWNITLALNSRARTASGFSGLKDMTLSAAIVHDNVQWSFFLAETLKYLYLLFSPSNTLSWDRWLFNTEAHIIPTRANPLRQKLRSKYSGLWYRLSKSLL